MRKIKNLGLLVSLLLVGNLLMAQLTTNSPYSKYGLGVLRPQNFSQNFAMGGTAVALRSDLNLNVQNPASYSELIVTTFEFNFMNNSLWMSDGNQSQYQTNPYISSLAIGFPIIQNVWGMSAGLMPVSSIGYDYTFNYTNDIVGSVTEINTGKGGLNRFYLGNGFKVNMNDNNALSFGANANFYFGQSTIDKKTVFGNLAQGVNVWELDETSTNDFAFDIGTQYQRKIARFDSTTSEKETLLLTVGANLSLARDLNTNYNRIVRSFIGSATFGSIQDTVVITNGIKRNIEMPLEYAVGFSLEKKNKWILAFDYRLADWTTIPSYNSLVTYAKMQSMAAGFQIIPKYDEYIGSYFKRIAYRFGMRYSSSYYTINNNDINEYGITFGTGLPLRRTGTSVPTLNLGIEYGKRGKATDGLIQETFINFNVGIIINDKWFIKRKYN